MNIKKVEELIEENKKLELNDDCAQERIWQEMYDILSVNLNETMQYLDGISKEDISYVCSIFDDLSEHFQSKELIECMEKNAKRTGFDCSTDIECAIEMLKNNLKYSKNV